MKKLMCHGGDRDDKLRQSSLR